MAVAAELDQLGKSLELGAKADQVICRPCSEEELKDEVFCLVNTLPQVLPDDDHNVVVALKVVEQLEALEGIARHVEDKFRDADIGSLVAAKDSVASLSQSALVLKLPLPNIRNVTAGFINTSEMLLE